MTEQPSWNPTRWRDDPDDTPPRPLLWAAPAVGLLAASTLGLQSFGGAFLTTGAAVLGTAVILRTRRPTTFEVVAVLTALALLSVCLLRNAEWLVLVCVLGACGLGTLVLVGGRTWTGLVAGSVTAGLVPLRAGRWACRGVTGLQIPTPAPKRAGLVVAVSALFLVLFGGLFVAADPAYAVLVNTALPSQDLPAVLRRAVVLVIVSLAVVVATYLARQPPAVDTWAPPPGRPLRRWEWAVPLVVLDLLFVSFVFVQLAVLFGGRDHVLATRGLSYADYARQGFWQLLVVTGLTLVVVAAAVRWAPRATLRDRRLVRILLGVLCLTALVVVASAMHRMSLYQQAYGYTRLRLFVDTIELVLGAVFVLVLAAGVHLRASWLPRSVVGLLASALLALAVLNPDAWIAEHDVHRWNQIGQIDIAYLSTLSADAVPALLRLPASLRACAQTQLTVELQRPNDPWYDANFARSRARRLLMADPTGTCTGS